MEISPGEKISPRKTSRNYKKLLSQRRYAKLGKLYKNVAILAQAVLCKSLGAMPVSPALVAHNLEEVRPIAANTLCDVACVFEWCPRGCAARVLVTTSAFLPPSPVRPRAGTI